MDDTTRELTSAIASGNTEAFSRFYQEHFDTMYRIAQQATRRDEAFCLDVVQDAMLRIIRSLPALDHDAALRAWLRKTVLSCAYDRIRKDTTHARLHEVAIEKMSHTSNRRNEDAHERLRWIEREMSALDESSSQLLLMRHRFGWTLSQIGRELGLSPGAVDGRLKRIIRSLRRRAEEKESRNDRTT